MRKYLSFVFLLILFPLASNALTIGSSYVDSVGYTHYTFSDGTTATSYKDVTGQTKFNLSDGSYGSAYTDLTGTVHYNFSDSSFINKKNTVVYGRCSINYSNFICLTENQYQEIYASILSGMPSCNTSGSESGGAIYLSGNTEYCSLTAEGKEQYILNSSTGQRLKLCRDSINLYKQMQANYDKCVQEEDQRYINSIQLKLDYLAQQTRSGSTAGSQNQPSSLTCIVNSHATANGCECDQGYFWHKSSIGLYYCKKCEDIVKNSHFDSSIANCVCNNGYNYNATNNTCDAIVNNTQNTANQTPQKITSIPVENKVIPPTKTAASEVNSSTQVSESQVSSLGMSKRSDQPSNDNGLINFFRNLGSAIKEFFTKLKFW